MANKLAIATDNLTTAGTWVTGNTGTNAVLISTSTGTTALTTSNQDSATFTPAAQASQYLAVRLGSRATGSPSNKLTVILRRTVGPAADIWTFVINVSDLPACSTAADEGGWVVFKAASSHTPNGTDTYLVRCKLDSTSTAVSLCTNGTTANWQRALFQTATGAPAAGDDMLIAGIWNDSNPATSVITPTVTMDQTAATDYGSNQTNSRVAALNICKGGTLSFGTGASNYIMQLSGFLVVYSNGTLNIGTTGSPIPRTATATLQFDCAADGDFGLIARAASTVNAQGLSRTSGKNFTWTLLTADVSAAGTSLTVADDTGWLNGDSIAIASTSRTATEAESIAMTADATSTTITVGAGVAAAHKGSTAEKMQAEVVLLTRNVNIKSVSATALSIILTSGTATLDFDWVNFQNMGPSGGSNNAALTISTTTGSCTLSYCVFQNVEHTTIDLFPTNALAGGTVVIEHTCAYNVANTSTSGHGFLSYTTARSSGTCTINDCVIIGDNSINSWPPLRIMASLSGITLTDIRISSFGGSSGVGVGFTSETSGTDHLGTTIGPFYLHSGGGGGLLRLDGFHKNLNFDTIYAWRAAHATLGIGIYFVTNFQVNVKFTGTTVCYGNQVAGVNVDSVSLQNVVFYDLRCYADTSFAQASGLRIDTTGAGGYYLDLRVLKGDFGTASGLWTTHTADIFYDASSGGDCIFSDVVVANSLFASGTVVSGGPAAYVAWPYNRLYLPYYNRSATTHKTMTSVGDIAYETGTVDASPSIKMTPSSATIKLDTSAQKPNYGFYVPVDNGGAPVVSVKVQKDGSYNGNAPRLMLRANSGMGVNTDTVIDTFSGGSGSWDTLSGTCPTATAKGVYEFYVDCDGTAGNIFVDTFTATGVGADSVSNLGYWYQGLPC